MRADRVPLVSAERCAEITAAVLQQRSAWTQRHDTLPSFTLGAACYLDVPQHGLPKYVFARKASNRVLRAGFKQLYETLCETLSAHLQAPVFLTRRHALPGFHIYEAHPQLHTLKPVIHFDLQDLRLSWTDKKPRTPEGRISFTMPVALPQEGGGIHLWDIVYEQFSSHREALKAAEDQAPQTVLYNLGELFVHSGDNLHQIASGRMHNAQDARITLQGHGRRCEEGWELYW